MIPLMLSGLTADVPGTQRQYLSSDQSAAKVGGWGKGGESGVGNRGFAVPQPSNRHGVN